MTRPAQTSSLFPYTTLFRSRGLMQRRVDRVALPRRRLLRVPEERRRSEGQFEQVMQPFEPGAVAQPHPDLAKAARREALAVGQDRKSTRLNSSHTVNSYAVF